MGRERMAWSLAKEAAGRAGYSWVHHCLASFQTSVSSSVEWPPHFTARTGHAAIPGTLIHMWPHSWPGQGPSFPPHWARHTECWANLGLTPTRAFGISWPGLFLPGTCRGLLETFSPKKHPSAGYPYEHITWAPALWWRWVRTIL